MRSRVLRIAILLFEALWLNVIVPGHRRGVVALPGERCSTCATQVVVAKACCANKAHPAKAPDGRDPAEHCAICYFAARLSAPVVIDFTLPPLALIGFAEPRQAEEAPAIHFFATYDGRAPPVCFHAVA
jgi:hypothetical protein